jgi:hypothetical protein
MVVLGLCNEGHVEPLGLLPLRHWVAMTSTHHFGHRQIVIYHAIKEEREGIRLFHHYYLKNVATSRSLHR